jgi:Ca2+-binding RTX toxin-like protein
LAGVNDTQGREWRQLYETTGLSWDQVASVCPRDGVTPCSGTVGGRVLTGWVWGSDRQVVELLSEYAPGLATADPPQLSGPEQFLPAAGFLGVMRYTAYVTTTYSNAEWTDGWTASTDADGAPIGGRVSFGWPPPSGQFAVGAAGTASESRSDRGVWLWRTAGLDYSPPVITPTLTGTLGSNGWYRSNVSLTWDVTDAESPIDSQTGCDQASVTADTAGTSFTCDATSAGGTSSATATVKRDATPPTVTCQSPAPVYSLGQVGARVQATVTDDTSGPLSASVSGPAATGAKGSFTAPVTGSDRAGNTTTVRCAYTVVVPACNGLTPTIVGTAGNDTIAGGSGRDVILALAGNDTIKGNDGDDVVCGGDGNDTIEGGNGADWIDGGGGSDSIRGDNGYDTCLSGELKMSSCEVTG